LLRLKGVKSYAPAGGMKNAVSNAVRNTTPKIDGSFVVQYPAGINTVPVKNVENELGRKSALLWRWALMGWSLDHGMETRRQPVNGAGEILRSLPTRAPLRDRKAGAK